MPHHDWLADDGSRPRQTHQPISDDEVVHIALRIHWNVTQISRVSATLHHAGSVKGFTQIR